jgi:PncC family amidohydrolase
MLVVIVAAARQALGHQVADGSNGRGAMPVMRAVLLRLRSDKLGLLLRFGNIRDKGPVPGAKADRRPLERHRDPLAPAPNETEEAARRLLSKASERGLMLATAESCTGGMLASLLTDVQGVAHSFDRGFVTYSYEAKNEMLGIPMEVIEPGNAVTKEVAIAMAEGALERSRANVTLAITGFADKGHRAGARPLRLRPGRPSHGAPGGAFRAHRPGRDPHRMYEGGDRHDDGDALMAKTPPFEAIHRHGFVRVAAATPVASSATSPSTSRRRWGSRARGMSAERPDRLSELNISSYAVDDLHLQEAFLDAVEEGIADLCRQTADLSPVLAVGAPLRRNGRLYNCALAISRGRILGVVPKSFLPNYREYYEKRWFAMGFGLDGMDIAVAGQLVPFGTDLIFAAEDLDDFIFHMEICEDYWAPQPPSTVGALSGALILATYPPPTSPSARRMSANCSAPPNRPAAARVYFCSLGARREHDRPCLDGQGSIYEFGEMLRNPSRFARDPELALADIDVQRLRLERCGWGRSTIMRSPRGIPRRRPGASISSISRASRTSLRTQARASPMCRTGSSSSTRIATRRSTSRCRASPAASRRPPASIL